MTKFKLKTLKLTKIKARFKHFKKSELFWQTGFIVGTVFILGAILLVSAVTTSNRYKLSGSDQVFTGTSPKSLLSKTSYVSKDGSYYLNKDGIGSLDSTATTGPPTADSLKHIGQSNGQYSLKMPVKPSTSNSGVTIYDDSSHLSLSYVPQFPLAPGKLVNGHMVYPTSGGGKVVYTPKTNGVREDIIYQKAPSNSISFSYKLKLSSYLEARAMPDGSIGVYSADPSLFGSITYGSSSDQASVMKAREKSAKNYLVFAILAPKVYTPDTVNTQFANNPRGVSTKLSVKNGVMVATVTGLKNIHTTFSIDPSIIVPSAPTFKTGDNIDSNISYGAAGVSITTAALTGGSARGGFSSGGASLPGTADPIYASVMYNGYIYALGVNGTSNANSNLVRYALISGTGNVGTWNSTASFTTGRNDFAAAAYNGYVYILGGYSSGQLNDVQYAQINSDGSLGPWAATSSFSGARYGHGAVAYNGYLYLMGGLDDANDNLEDTQYAPIKSDGSLGSWQATASATFDGREFFAVAAYNGYLYALGGFQANGDFPGASVGVVQYAAVTSSGALGSWANTVNLGTGRSHLGAVAYNGYLYSMGGTSSSSTVQYAQINSDGTIGLWAVTSSFSNGRYDLGAVAFNGHLIIYGGNAYADVQKATIDAAGVIAPWVTQTNITTTPGANVFRTGSAAVAYNHTLYVIGGVNASGVYLATVNYAPIDSSGSVGSYTQNGSIFPAVSGITAFRAYGGAVGYNGYLFYFGGWDGSTTSNTVFSVRLNESTGAPISGTWTIDSNNMPNKKREFGYALYNGYLYVIAGYDGTNSLTQQISYTHLTSVGDDSAWTNLGGSVKTSRVDLAAVVSGPYLYIIGGRDAGGTLDEVWYTLLSPTGGESLPSPCASGITNSVWCKDSATISARSAFGAVATNGYLYIYGGFDGAIYLSGSQYAKTTSTGALGDPGCGSTWCTGTSMPATREFMGYAVYSGYIYAAGGDNASTVANTNTWDVQVNNGGPGATGDWSSGPTFSTAGQYPVSVAYNDHLYVFAVDGSSGCESNPGKVCVYSSTINPSGSLKGDGVGGTTGAWGAKISSVSTGANYGFGVVAYNDHVYVIGGLTYLNSVLGTVWSASINNDGTLGSWSQLSSSSLNTARYGMGTVAYNGYMYAVGGSSVYNTTYLNSVEKAPINSDGTLGSWASTTSFTNARAGLGSLAYDGYLYVFAGATNSTFYNDVQYAVINANGTIGSWSTTNGLEVPRSNFGIAAYNGYVYITGGTHAGSNTLCSGTGGLNCNDTLFAPILTGGKIGTWQESPNTFSVSRSSLASAVYNGHLYVIAGQDNTPAAINDTQYSGLLSQPRIGQYTQLLDVTGYSDSDPTPIEVGLSGTNTNNPGLGGVAGLGGIRSSYTFASNGCAKFFSPWNTLDSGLNALSGTSPVTFTSDGCGGTNLGLGRYALIGVTLDDTQTATFPDIDGNHSSLTGYTLYYHPASNYRLRGGKTFSNETQQSLDAAP